MEMGTQKDMSRKHLPVGKYSDVAQQNCALIHRQSARSHLFPHISLWPRTCYGPPRGA
jgi:hypothetical protein